MSELNTQEEFETIKGRHIGDGSFNIRLKDKIINAPLTINFGCNVVEIVNCTFNQPITISGGVQSTLNIKNCTFNREVSFDDLTVKENARMQSNTWKDKVYFNNSRFEKLADFWSSTFHKPVIFFKTDFVGIAVFAIAEFKGPVLFTYSLIAKHLILRGAKFRDGLDLSQAILDGSINSFEAVVEGKSMVSPADDEEFESWVATEAIIPIKNERETYRILKKQTVDSGNYIEAGKYWKKEIVTFSREIELMPWKGKFWFIVQNRTVLFLNLVSNNHNASWMLGATFTILVGAFSFFAAFVATEDIEFAWRIPDGEEFWGYTISQYIIV